MTTEELGPLRARATQLHAAAARDKEAHLRHYETSARPALKELAASMKESLGILMGEEAALRERLEGMAQRAVAGAPPSVHTGFNVIRARTAADGGPLSIEELRAERARLVETLETLAAQVEAAKREVTRAGARPADREIWETQLVALQDTRRVYRDEINLLEVELLGREHSERIAAERAAAEASGAAQLQRLQEQVVQTRVKYNRAKYQYYYPFIKGFNIQFGGGGIFGACKNIDISEINGYVTVRGDVGEVAPDGRVLRPARLTVQLEAPGAHKQQAGQAQANGTASKPPIPRKASQLSTGGSLRGGGDGSSVGGSGVEQQGSFRSLPASPARPGGPQLEAGHITPHSTRSGASGRPPTAPTSAVAPPASPAGAAAKPAPARVEALRTSKSARSLAESAASLESSGSDKMLEAAAAAAVAEAAPPARSQLGAASAPHGQLAGGKEHKGKNAALRFLSGLRSKKDKYTAKGRGLALQPTISEDVELGPEGDKGKRRTLAGKLLGRGRSKSGKAGGDAGSSTGSLDRLAFGSHQLRQPGHRRRPSGLAGESVDEEASQRSDSLDDDSPDFAPHSGSRVAMEMHEGDGSLASDDESSEEEGTGGAPPRSPLTQDMLQQVFQQQSLQQQQQQQQAVAQAAPHPPPAKSSSSRGGGSWLRGFSGSMAPGEGGSALDEASSVISLGDLGAEAAEAPPAGSFKQGVFVTGRLSDFELTGERGTKCPNLSIGQADVTANVYVRFDFVYDKEGGAWRQGDKPQFDVQHLQYKLKGNNVPMPSTLVKHLLRIFIPEIIQRRLLPLLPKEFGDYMLTAQRGFEATADVAVVGPGLKVLDADLAFEVRGPARSAKEARKQQQKYAAAKEARSMLGLSLPQAQVLAELFGGRSALLDPPRPATIKTLVAFQAYWDRHPHLYDQICQVWNTAFQVVAARQRAGAEAADFSFRAFMDGPVSRVRRKPARARVLLRSLDVGVNVDGVITMLHDYTQRTLEELFIKGPIANTRDNPEFHQESLEEQQEVLHAWHSWVLRELDLFKSKFRGAAATLLGAGDCRGFSLGVENAYYEGPLRLRLPVNMQLDADGAFSFEAPLPSPEGALGQFVDGFKSLVIPSHLRPPAQAINWIALSGDPAVDAAMQRQVTGALEAIRDVLVQLRERIEEQGLEAEDMDPEKVLACPRTKVGDRLGRFIVNRLKVRVRLDERRIGEILSGIDSASMGAAFVSTAGRLLGHLGDVMTLGFTPAAVADPKAAGDAQPPSQYLFQFESSDISRLRADVQSLGFVSLVSPGGMVRLAHAVIKHFLLAFKGVSEETLQPLEERFRTWYSNMSRAGLDISMCLDAKAALADNSGHCLLRFVGAAEEDALRETSPLILVNDLDLVPLGRAMRGDPPPQQHAPHNNSASFSVGPGPNSRW